MTRILINPASRAAIAEAIYTDSHPGALAPAHYTDGSDVWFSSPTDAWAPWPIDTEVIDVRHLLPAHATIDESSYRVEPDNFAAVWATWQAAMPADADTTDDQEVRAWAQANRGADYERLLAEIKDNTLLFIQGELDAAYDVDAEGVATAVALDAVVA